MAKKTKRRSTTPSIADQIIRKLGQLKQSRVVDLGLFQQARNAVLQQKATATEGLSELHPFHAAATYVVNAVGDSAALLAELPELSKLAARVASAEEDYMPTGPPMSPITLSYFNYWTLFDFTIGLKDETFGSIAAAISKAMGSDPGYVEFVEHLCRSRPGLYVCEGREGRAFVLRELVTGSTASCLVPSGYQAETGDLLLVRLLPPVAHFRESLAVTTPYVIRKPGLAAWEAYFSRTLRGAEMERANAYERLMKRGALPHGARYWTEYIFEAYVGHRTEVIFLEGLPDVAASRLHSTVNAGEGRPAPPGKIAKTLLVPELERLPKLSATLIEFADPFMGGVPPSATLAQLRDGMTMVELMWNAPLLMEHGDPSAASELKRQIDERFRLLPRELRACLEGMLRERSTTYAYDPRLADVRVVDDGNGGFTVQADSRLLGGPPRGWRAP